MVRTEWHDCFSCRITGTVYTFWNLFGGALNDGTRKNNTRVETARTKCMHIFRHVVLKLTPVCTCVHGKEKFQNQNCQVILIFETLIGTLKQNTKLAYTDKVFCENSIAVNVEIIAWSFEKKIKVKFCVFLPHIPHARMPDVMNFKFSLVFFSFFQAVLAWQKFPKVIIFNLWLL